MRMSGGIIRKADQVRSKTMIREVKMKGTSKDKDGVVIRTAGTAPRVKTSLEIVIIAAEIMQMVTMYDMNPLLTMIHKAPPFS